MLQTIREKAQGVFAWIILLIIGVPFALWGIQNYLHVGKEMPVVSVGDQDFYDRDVNRAYLQYRQNFADQAIDETTLRQQALEKLIRDEVLLQYAEGAGLVASDDAVRQFIGGLPYFQVDGRFDKNRYQALLASQGMTSLQFAERIRKALIMEQLQRAIIDSEFVVQRELERYFQLQNQRRHVEVLTIPRQIVTTTPDDAALQAYYQAHQNDYRTPEQVAIEYIELSLPQLAEQVSATEEQLQAYYEEHKSRYTTPERRKISHILFIAKPGEEEQTLAKAQAARQRLANEDFAELAKTLSEDPLTAQKGGDLGLFTPGVMEPAFEEAVNALQHGEVSEPVKTSFGYHLIKVTELQPGTIKPYDAVREEIKTAYQRAQAETRFYELGEKLGQLSYENQGNLEAVATATGLTLQRSEPFTRDQGTGIASAAKLRDAAFSEEVLQGNNSEPIELDPEHVVVLRITDHQPAALQALEQVKERVIADWQRQQADEQTRARAEDLKNRAQAGATLASLAEAEKLKLETYEALTRRASELPWMLTRAIFGAVRPTAERPTVANLALADGAWAVFKVLSVSNGELSEEQQTQQATIRQNMARAFGQLAFDATLSTLRERAKVTVRTTTESK